MPQSSQVMTGLHPSRLKHTSHLTMSNPLEKNKSRGFQASAPIALELVLAMIPRSTWPFTLDGSKSLCAVAEPATTRAPSFLGFVPGLMLVNRCIPAPPRLLMLPFVPTVLMIDPPSATSADDIEQDVLWYVLKPTIDDVLASFIIK